MSQFNPTLNIAFKAARRAGDMMLRASNQLPSLKIDTKSFNEFIIDVVEQAQTTICTILSEAYPNYPIYTSDMPFSVRGNYQWVVNPLDGIVNYQHGHPDYAISIALLHKGIVQEALIYAPERNDLYTALRGKGALLNDRRIRVSPRIELNQCLIATEFVAQECIEQRLSLLTELWNKTAGLRHTGTTALDLCSLAVGRIDGFFNFNLNVYQTIAAALLVQEAGGIVTDMKGNDTWLENGDMVAANPKVLAQILQLIAKL